MRQGFFSSLPVLQNESTLPKCGLCQLDKTCKSPKMKVSGKGKKKILIIAEAPGKEEDALGKQLVGNSGRDLERILRKFGVDMREDCWLENALRCRPPENKISNDKCIEWCRPNVSNTIKELKPEKIILLGASAIESFMAMYWKHDKDYSPSRWGGYQIPLIALNAWVCATYHPAALLHSKDKVMELIFNRHLEAACKLKGRPYGEGGTSLPNYEAHIAIHTKYRKDCLRGLHRIAKFWSPITFDFETNMLKPDKPESKIYTCSICLGGSLQTLAFPMVGEFIPLTIKILEDPEIRKNGWNQQFETVWALAKLGVEVKNWGVDGMLVAHGIENASKLRKISSLDFQAFVNLGVANWDGQVGPYLKRGSKEGYAVNKIKDCPLEPLLRYNALDSLYEMLVTQKQSRRIMDAIQRS